MKRVLFILLLLPSIVYAGNLSLDQFIDSKCQDVSDDVCVDMYMAYTGKHKQEYRDDVEDYYDKEKEEYRFSYGEKKEVIKEMYEKGEFSKKFQDSDAVHDEELLKAMQDFMERECKGVAEIECAEKFLSQENSKKPDPSYKIYKKKRPKLIREFKKHHPDFED